MEILEFLKRSEIAEAGGHISEVSSPCKRGELATGEVSSPYKRGELANVNFKATRDRKNEATACVAQAVSGHSF